MYIASNNRRKGGEINLKQELKECIVEAMMRPPTLESVLGKAERRMGEPLSETDEKGIIKLVEEHGPDRIEFLIAFNASLYGESLFSLQASGFVESDYPSMAEYLKIIGHSSLTKAIEEDIANGVGEGWVRTKGVGRSGGFSGGGGGGGGGGGDEAG